MLSKFLHFIKYHNAVSIAVLLVFLGAGGAAAASEEVRDVIVDSEEKITQIDNSFILNADFAVYAPGVRITDVSEDDELYYIAYTLDTIGIADGVWQKIVHEKTLEVHKTLLDGGDLGLYVADELGEVVEHELAYLKEAQKKERGKGEQAKVVSTTYSGLVGKMLKPKEEVFDGYEPVVKQPELAENNVAADTAPVAAQSNSSVGQGVAAEAPQQVGVVAPPQTASVASVVAPANVPEQYKNDRTPPSIFIIGANPAKIPTQGTYSDNGALVTDNTQINIGYQTFVNGELIDRVVKLDTSTTTEHTIKYVATDAAGNTASADRRVIIYDRYGPRP